MTSSRSQTDTFKETDIGPIPVGWEVTTIGDLIQSKALSAQNGFPCGNHNQEGRGTPHLRPFNVSEDGNVSLDTIKFIETDRALDRYLLAPGDVLFNNTNSEALVGKTAYWDKAGDYVLSNHMTIIRVLDAGTVEPFFLAKHLHKLWHDTFYCGICRRHVNQASISLARLKNVPVPLPPLPEQRRIAQVLSTIQEAIAAQEDLVAAARETKRSLMQRLFTYGPGPEPAPTQETEIGEIPAHWEVVRLGELANFKNGINFKSDQKGRGILTVDVLNMYAGGMAVRMDNLYRVDKDVGEHYLLRSGDILIVRSSLKQEGVAWPCLFLGHTEPVTFCGFLIRARLQDGVVLPEFLVNYLRLSSVRQLLVSKSGKVAITNINQGNLKSLAVYLPPIQEQERIVMALRTVDAKIVGEEQRKTALQALFQSMLHQLMTGQIRVVNAETQSRRELADLRTSAPLR